MPVGPTARMAVLQLGSREFAPLDPIAVTVEIEELLFGSVFPL